MDNEIPNTNTEKGKQKADENQSQISDSNIFTEEQKAILPLIATDIEAGTRAYALGQWEISIKHFGQLSELSEQAFGNQSQRYADSLVMYGRALLQSAIAQSELMGQKKLEETNLKGAELAGENQEKTVNNPKIHFEGEPDFESSGFDDQVDSESFNEVASSSMKAGSSSKNPQENDNTGNDSGSDEENDENCDFQTAWQVLDVARIIQANDKTEKGQLKLAETLLLLGDVSMESENFTQASIDYTESLKIKNLLLSPDDRQIAEVNFKLSLASEYNGKKQEALEQIQAVKKSLLLRIDNCEKSSELDNLKELIVDVEEKEKELIHNIESEKSKKNENGNIAPSSTDSVPFAISDETKKLISNALSSGNVNDLTGMVRSKKSKTTNTNKEPSKPETDAKPLETKPTEVGNSTMFEITNESSQPGKRKMEDSATSNVNANLGGVDHQTEKKSRVEEIAE
ncbi:hypothetical protein BB558_001879 [Smittium angustum]|uniref:Tetratricopeptide SHNi-TPR domain-containing protein n=1 Tax=Smittium angustum TaxID=133377 RepID=A0A2U1J061_SMIAN|nr:hypothetical protein BB558_005544 [Smittium angustum]PWA01994.1 hypothetical protein BB558_001879 [Smittium angustum]